MSPSSLIFVAVLAIWVTYLVVHTARRREQLATARAVDRFSSQMRVLQRRAVTYSPPETAARVSSASLTRPRPLVASTAPEVLFASVAEAPAEVVSPVEPTRPVGGAPVRASRPFALLGGVTGISARRVRGLSLLAALAFTLISGVSVALGLAPWPVPVAGVAIVAAVLVWLRRSARAELAARRRRRAARQVAEERAAQEAARALSEARPSAPELPVAQEFAPARDAVTQTLQVPATQTMPVVEAETVDPLFADAGWEPTPVPPPTYTLKAKADRPVPEPLEVPGVPVPIEVEADEVTWDTHRGQPRVVNG